MQRNLSLYQHIHCRAINIFISHALLPSDLVAQLTHILSLPFEVRKKQLRPISLTPCLSKFAEDCVVVDYAKPAVLQILDPNQYGAVPKSSTTQALIHMVHHWSKETDGNGATVRVTLFDYQKAFDLIDHKILVSKLCNIKEMLYEVRRLKSNEDMLLALAGQF